MFYSHHEKLLNLEYQINYYLENGEVDEADTLLNDFLETSDNLRSDILNLSLLINEATARIKARKTEISRLKAQEDKDEKSIERMKAAIEKGMGLLGDRSLKNELTSVSLRSRPKSVKILDFDKIPEDYLKVETTVKPKLNEIKKLIQSSEEPITWASLEVDGSEYIVSIA